MSPAYRQICGSSCLDYPAPTLPLVIRKVLTERELLAMALTLGQDVAEVVNKTGMGRGGGW